ncbi:MULTISPECIES: hypothetical protein [Streptomyces]|uniref:Uncharacterized protein n=1 Tax=Streptomyces dubilierae TaxID=3075533 RepID=A0ABU2P5V0_9ACTN|nr:hypothetical protein [Streptomyces sp. DSM 41921]MDT0387522.1 hypothetical protein [Streptomyces sp. DSM 41921]
MSLRVRRIAVVSLAALALTAGGTVMAAAASAQPAAAAIGNPGPDGFGGGGHGHDRPLHFGPFEFPRYGSVSGGFSWGVRD